MKKLLILKSLLAKLLLLLSLSAPSSAMLGGASPNVGDTIVVDISTTSSSVVTTTQTFGYWDEYRSSTGTTYVMPANASSYAALRVKGVPPCAVCGTWKRSFEGYH